MTRRLQLEPLESRDLPSGLNVEASGRLTDVAVDGGGVSRMSTDRGWERLSTAPAIHLAVNDAGTVAAGYSDGLYRYLNRTGWNRLSTARADLVDLDDDGQIVASFTGGGLWRFQTDIGWRKLGEGNPTLLSLEAGRVAAYYPGTGLYSYSTQTGWTLLSRAVAQSISISETGRVLAGFAGGGLWDFTPNQGWRKIGDGTPVDVAQDSAGGIAAAYGPGGVWRRQNGWEQLSAANATEVAISSNGQVGATFAGGEDWLFGYAGWQRITSGPGGSVTFDTAWATTYIPSGFRSVTAASPLLVSFTPSGAASFSLDSFRDDAERYGFVLYGDKLYANGSSNLNATTTSVKARLDEAIRTLPVQATQVILTGSSGGGSFAHHLSLTYPGLADALVINTGMVWGRTIPENTFNGPNDSDFARTNAASLRSQYAGTSRQLAVFLTSPGDFRAEEMQRDIETYTSFLRWGVREIAFPGGHIFAPDDIYRASFDWITTRSAWVG